MLRSPGSRWEMALLQKKGCNLQDARSSARDLQSFGKNTKPIMMLSSSVVLLVCTALPGALYTHKIAWRMVHYLQSCTQPCCLIHWKQRPPGWCSAPA